MKPLPTEPAEGSVPFFSYSSLISYNTAIILILSSAYGKKKKKVSFLKEEERTLVSEQSRSNHKEDTELRWTFLLGAVPYHSPPSCDHHSLTAFRGSPLGTQAWTQPPPPAALCRKGTAVSPSPLPAPCLRAWRLTCSGVWAAPRRGRRAIPVGSGGSRRAAA